MINHDGFEKAINAPMDDRGVKMLRMDFLRHHQSFAI